MGAPLRIGCLVDDADPEQSAAYDWCESRFDAVARCRPESFDPTEYDVLWWHRVDPVDPAMVSDGGPLSTFVRDGGTLLLTLAAMTAVEPLGFDGVGPDAVGWAEVTDPTGPLWKRLYADHPIAAGFDTLRVHTRGAGVTAPYARYETVAPTDGDVLASTARGDHDAVAERSVVSWQPGAGRVVGIGSALSFRQPTHDICRGNRETLVANAISFLADEETVPLTGRPKDSTTLSAMRDRLGEDPHRPGYHVTPPANWLNDPNGLVHWNGRYHVFYQYNPTGPFHGTIHWGHAVSDDLVHWEDRPVALSPSPDGPDRDGCWSGCTVDDDGVATILYTGGRGTEQLPCLATSTDESLTSWVKDPENPVIDELPAEPEVLRTEDWDGEFRDHCVWREDGVWHQLIGAGMEGGGGAALLYVSTDLREWTYRGPILTGDRDSAGTVWECPELLNFGERQLLHVSNYEDVMYFLGQYDDGKFTVERRGKLDHGDFYAPQSMWTDDGRTLTWGWVQEARDVGAQWDAGWSGSLSVPRELTLAEDGGLRQRPAAALTELRGEGDHRENLRLRGEEGCELDVQSRQFELKATVRLEDADAVELRVLETPDGEEQTPIRYTAASEVVVDRTQASTAPEATTDSQRMTVTPYDAPLSLHAFVDGSIVEVFANERHCLTSRVYPERTDATGISLAATGGTATVTGLDCWELGSAWRS
ncbi:GH32 C-terminal domain-containing protein [Halomicroarcula sp. F28]|uniref:GH32 C-terminal domain-containing protein n=1 Tax=Haloarcula salinisoli TaxID=2487746 RepID=UPI001C730C49|nr:GH32 C-terminal domain-containing protein [Halomicroarcula salinisoli]MBX0284917.1 GH32 C-terminal domain-containing protein [Halomicroarcula salinisoli]